MRKILPFILLALMLSIGLGFFVVQNIEPYRDVPLVTLDRLNQYETEWYASGVPSYRMLVLATFGDQQRRYEVEVSDYVLTGARSSQWDEAGERWPAMEPVSDEEASFFSVQGLFGMLRKDLVNEQVEREVMRIQVDPTYSYPALIYLGDLIVEAEAQDDTALVIEVLEFEILDR